MKSGELWRLNPPPNPQNPAMHQLAFHATTAKTQTEQICLTPTKAAMTTHQELDSLSTPTLKAIRDLGPRPDIRGACFIEAGPNALAETKKILAAVTILDTPQSTSASLMEAMPGTHLRVQELLETVETILGERCA